MAQHEPIRIRRATRTTRGSASGGSGSSGSTTRQEIPDKLYFRIGEVAKLCAIPAYVLRFWEGEFPQLRPNKGGTGQRLYRRRDVEMALRIKTLLYDEGYTIPGARQAFKVELRTARDPQAPVASDAATTPDAAPVDASHLHAIRKELVDIHALLSRPASSKSSTVQSIRPIRQEPEPTPRPRPTPRVLPKPIPFQSLFDQFDEPNE